MKKAVDVKGRITFDRTFQAPVEDVWDLWTTKEGIESWWGPEGFHVKVRKLDLRVGGELLYDMIASDPQAIAFMKREGMPTSHAARIRFTDVTVNRRLAYLHSTDFIPDITPYEVETVVELSVHGDDVRMTLTFDAMHDEIWSQRQAAGWESELRKLTKVLGG